MTHGLCVCGGSGGGSGRRSEMGAPLRHSPTGRPSFSCRRLGGVRARPRTMLVAVWGARTDCQSPLALVTEDTGSATEAAAKSQPPSPPNNVRGWRVFFFTHVLPLHWSDTESPRSAPRAHLLSLVRPVVVPAVPATPACGCAWRCRVDVDLVVAPHRAPPVTGLPSWAAVLDVQECALAPRQRGLCAGGWPSDAKTPPPRQHVWTGGAPSWARGGRPGGAAAQVVASVRATRDRRGRSSSPHARPTGCGRPTCPSRPCGRPRTAAADAPSLPPPPTRPTGCGRAGVPRPPLCLARCAPRATLPR